MPQNLHPKVVKSLTFGGIDFIGHSPVFSTGTNLLLRGRMTTCQNGHAEIWDVTHRLPLHAYLTQKSGQVESVSNSGLKTIGPDMRLRDSYMLPLPFDHRASILQFIWESRYPNIIAPAMIIGILH
ncbi:hypothetical protein Tco_0760868 [Tanacetum coccineum]